METELVLLTRKRDELLKRQREDDQRQRTLARLQGDRDSLQLIRGILQQQYDDTVGQQNPTVRNSEDGWVMVPRNNLQNEDNHQ